MMTVFFFVSFVSCYKGVGCETCLFCRSKLYAHVDSTCDVKDVSIGCTHFAVTTFYCCMGKPIL